MQAIVNVKVDSKVKKQAQKVAEELGLSLSALINAYLRQLIRNKTVTFSTSEEPSDYLIESLKVSGEDIKAGRVMHFSDGDETLDYLDKLIADEQNSKKN